MQTRPSALAGSIEPLEARIAPAANLSIGAVTLKLPSVAVPGDTGIVSIQLLNTGDQASTGTSGIHVFLSNDTVLGGDFFLSEFEDQSVVVKAGGQRTINKSFKLPALTLPFPQVTAGDKFIIAQLVAEGLSKASPKFTYAFEFGEVGDRKTPAALEATDADGTIARFVVIGPGHGTLTPNGGLVDLSFTGTTEATRAGVITTARGASDKLVPLHAITADAPLNQLNLLGATVSGAVGLGQGVNALALGDVGGTGAGITLGVTPSGKPAKIVLGRVHELALTSASGIDTLQVVDWLDEDATPDLITAPFLGKLVTTGNARAGVAGDFAASLSLSGADAQGMALGSANIHGKLSHGTWTISGAGHNTGGIKAGGGANGWTFTGDGFVKDIKLGGDLVGDKSDAGHTLQALSFDNITVAGNVNAKLVATGVAPSKYAMDILTALSLQGVVIEAKEGGIKTIDIGDWVGGGKLATKWIGALLTDGKKVGTLGDFTPDVTLTGRPSLGGGSFDAPKPIKGALNVASIAGLLNGAWTVADDIGLLSAGSVLASWKLDGGDSLSAQPTRIDHLAVKGTFDGELEVAILKDAKLDGDFTGKIILSNPIFSSFGTFKFARVLGGVIEAAGGLNRIEALDWNQGSLKAKALNALVILGSVRLGVAGDLARATVEATGGAINLIDVHGSITDSTVRTTDGASIVTVQASRWVDGTLHTGDLSKLTLDGDKVLGLRGDLTRVTVEVVNTSSNFLPSVRIAGLIDTSLITFGSGLENFIAGGMLNSRLTAGSEIDAFVIKGAADLSAPLFTGSGVVAPSFRVVVIRDVAPAGAIAFVQANEIASYQRYEGKDVVQSFMNLTNPSPVSFSPDIAGSYVLTIL